MRFFIAAIFALSALADYPNQCEYDKECLIDIPGSQCADGTLSYITLTRRAGARNLLVYLKAGGACWDAKSCNNGLARPLTRVERPTEWNVGLGIHGNNPQNPFASDFDIVTIPYCTGDAFTGNNVSIYSDGKRSMTIRHRGFENVKLSLDKIRSIVPSPERAVLLGCSAGGIGAFFHLRNFRDSFPDARRYVISDAGLPFKPPHVDDSEHRRVLKNWGADKILESFPSSPGQPLKNFGELIRFNTENFSDTRFGFISSYRDAVMTFFGLTIGSPVGMKIVRNNIIDIADNSLGREIDHARVFFTDTNTHCHSPKDLLGQDSLGVTLSAWMTDMIQDRKWPNVRPDLFRRIHAAGEVEDETERQSQPVDRFPDYP